MKKSTSTTNLIACAAIIGAVALGFATGPASAQAPRKLHDIEFKFVYDKAELGSLPATEKLLARLETEVRKVCAEKIASSAGPSLVRACVNNIMRASVPKFDSVTVAQAYDLRAGG